MPKKSRRVEETYVVFPWESKNVIGTDTFRYRPQSLQIVATLEVAIRDAQGASMLVMCPRYEPVEQEHGAIPDHEIEAGQWTPPFLNYRVDGEPPANVGQLLRAFRQALNRLKIEDDLKRYIDSLSCSLGDAEYVDGFIEYKHSWDSPRVMRAYLILRYKADLSFCYERALADAELLKGFRYLPIDDEAYRRATRTRQCELHNIRHTLFMRKPLATNLQHLLDDPGTRHSIREGAVDVGREHFFSQFAGILFCGDIANYGAACRYVRDKMSGGLFTRPDEEQALADDILRESAAIGFTQMFLDAGISHVHTAGDGFLCAIPCNNDQLSSAFGDFFSAYHRFLTWLEMTNQQITQHASRNGDEPPQLGSRLAVHVGDYRYGKIGLAASVVPAFDGAAIIDVSRLEQGLRAQVKSGDAPPPGTHHLILSTTAKERMGSLESGVLQHIDDRRVTSKESEQPASLYLISMPAT
jgi:hypothetical protein